MSHTNSSVFNVRPEPASIAGYLVYRLIWFYVFAIFSLFILSCKTPPKLASEDESSDSTTDLSDSIVRSWTEVTGNAGFDGRYYHTTAVFNDGSADALWVIGGYDGSYYRNDVWKSHDGITWTRVDPTGDVFSGRYGHTAAVFNDGSGKALWVIGGDDSFNKNDVYKSSDGTAWTRVTAGAVFSARNSHTTAVFDDKSGTGDALWVIGGWAGGIGSIKGDVWKSTDGITWQEITAEGPVFSGRYGHTTAVFDDGSGTGKALWVIGGYDGSYYRNDVWKSTNGKNWTQVKESTDDAGFPGRRYHTGAVFDDGSGSGEALWVIGGRKDNTLMNDVWKSTNGRDWTVVKESTDDAGFERRVAHTGAVFDDGSDKTLWIIGGFDENTADAGFKRRAAHAGVMFDNALWIIGGFDGSANLRDVWKYQ
ncbi:hypothetical protein CHS0354_018498 [Potamilus streckersoni]|uniref:Galactose oxidase n=1 Tax=Potamilus streckersoni TaxID=2493646 RepID=A0AAE0TBD0_9BIVA|nr:hypothetical protein CHS0354_018498 [Potamilus streckersoni]